MKQPGKERKNPFGGSAANDAHDQLSQRGNTYSAVPDPLPNQMLDSLEDYLDKIAASATQAVAKGGPIAELSASLAISIDTVAAQKKEIKRLYEHLNAMKKKCTQSYRIGTTAGGGLMGNVCPHCAAVGRTATHKNNSCYFDAKKMMDKREWVRKLMDKKGVACNDND